MVETTSRSWDADITGPFNHAQYGGWYLSFDLGTPVEMTVQRVQMEEGTVMLQAMNLPSNTVVGDIHLWAESVRRTYDFTLASSLDEVRAAEKGDLYWFDLQTKTLYWRVISGYVDADLTFDWINREEHGQESFTRANLSVANIITKNQFQLHIDISCVTDDNAAGAFCLEKPAFIVPGMGCPEGEVMLSIDKCGLPCELENNCEQDCSENGKERFYFITNKKGKHVYKTCKWLSKRTMNKAKKICNSKVDYHDGFGPPQDICVKTCNSCDSCFENKKSKFFLRLNTNGKPLYKTCGWLASRQNTANVCTKTKSYKGYGPPGNACPKTCRVGSCTGSNFILQT